MPAPSPSATAASGRTSAAGGSPRNTGRHSGAWDRRGQAAGSNKSCPPARPGRYPRHLPIDLEPDELPAAVAEQARANPWVKLVGDWIDRGEGDLAPLWPDDVLRAAIDATTGHLRAGGASATWVLSTHPAVRHPSRYSRTAREPASVPTAAVSPAPGRPWRAVGPGSSGTPAPVAAGAAPEAAPHDAQGDAPRRPHTAHVGSAPTGGARGGAHSGRPRAPPQPSVR